MSDVVLHFVAAVVGIRAASWARAKRQPSSSPSVRAR